MVHGMKAWWTSQRPKVLNTPVYPHNRPTLGKRENKSPVVHTPRDSWGTGRWGNSEAARLGFSTASYAGAVRM